jgi:hypothetical protein
MCRVNNLYWYKTYYEHQSAVERESLPLYIWNVRSLTAYLCLFSAFTLKGSWSLNCGRSSIWQAFFFPVNPDFLTPIWTCIMIYMSVNPLEVLLYYCTWIPANACWSPLYREKFRKWNHRTQDVHFCQFQILTIF